MARNINGLTAKQQVFCDLYRASEDPDIRGNATACYQLAYGGSTSNADANGSRLTKNKHVAIYLNTKCEQQEEATDITESRILQEVGRLAFFDPVQLFDEHGQLLSIANMSEDARRAIAALDVITDTADKKDKDSSAVSYTHKIKLSSKISALEMLMKWKKMLTQKVEHEGEIKTGGVLLVPGEVTIEAWKKQHYANNKQT